MSAINKMLQQISEQKAEGAEQPRLQAAYIDPIPSRWPKRIIAIVVLSAVAGGAWWLGAAGFGSAYSNPSLEASSDVAPIVGDKMEAVEDIAIEDIATDDIATGALAIEASSVEGLGNEGSGIEDFDIKGSGIENPDMVGSSVTTIAVSDVTASSVDEKESVGEASLESNTLNPELVSSEIPVIETLLYVNDEPVDVIGQRAGGERTASLSVMVKPTAVEFLAPSVDAYRRANRQGSVPLSATDINASSLLRRVDQARLNPDSEVSLERTRSVNTDTPLAVEVTATHDISEPGSLSTEADTTAASAPVEAVHEETAPQGSASALLSPFVSEHEQLGEEVPPASIEVKVESMSPAQLAEVAVKRAQEALDVGDIRKALAEYQSALRFAPAREDIRSQVAALHYGRRETREALTILQEGIARNPSSESLRLTMAKLLARESQSQTALSVLSDWFVSPSPEYAAMRGALAQQLSDNGAALESYQYLVTHYPEDGRWWLGLAIASDREGEAVDAQKAYQETQRLGGVSEASQAFVRQRLYALQQLQQVEE